MYCSPHPSAHLKPGRAKHCLPWVEEFQRSLQFGPDNSPKQQVHKLKAVLPDPRSPQSTLKKGFSEPATSNSEIIPVQVRAGRGANLPRKDMGKEGHDQLCAAQFSAVRTSLEMKEGNPECTGRGKNGCYCCISRARLYLFVFGTLFLTKSQCSHHKHTRRH